MNILQLGGGGAGFSHPGAGGGGGGAGGVVGNDPNIPSTYRASALSVSAATYTITVGAGGDGATYMFPELVVPVNLEVVEVIL